MTPQRWAVVGGGMLGLTLALRLARAGRNVTVFEAAPEVGGLASVWEIGGFTWDRHYHVVLLSDKHLRDLLADLGLEAEMVWNKTRTGFFHEGRLYPFNDARDFVRFPILGPVDKLRLGFNIWYASRLRDPRPLERISAVDWLGRWSGQRTLDRMWRPLLRSKLGDAADRVSAAFIWATIARLYAARRGGLKEERFGYLPGGYSRILTRLAEAVRTAGGEIRTNARVTSVRSDGAGVTIEAADGGRFDAAVLTAPPAQAAALLPDLPADERAALQAVEYQGILCASVVLRRPLGGFYVTNLLDPELPFTGVIEMSSLVDPAEFGGRHLVYLPRYAGKTDVAWGWTDDTLRTKFLGGLTRMYPDLSTEDVVDFRVSRVRQVFALPTLYYSDRLPPATTSLPMIYQVNSSQIVSSTLNVNETIALADTALESVLGCEAIRGQLV